MKNNKLLIIFALLVPLFSYGAYADDFGVNLKWSTSNPTVADKYIEEQNHLFNTLILSGDIKDVFVNDIQVNGESTKIVKFVIHAKDKQAVVNKLSHLPLIQKNIISIVNIVDLGEKWLDNLPPAKSYGFEFTWHKGIDSIEMDKAFGKDLNKVINLYNVGALTSSYLKVQNLGGSIKRPIYSITIIAKDKNSAMKLANSFESIKLNYADVNVVELGIKVKEIK